MTKLLTASLTQSGHCVRQFHTTADTRLFDVDVEGISLPDVDLFQLGGGVARKALTLDITTAVSDGFLSINLFFNVPMIDNPSKFASTAA